MVIHSFIQVWRILSRAGCFHRIQIGNNFSNFKIRMLVIWYSYNLSIPLKICLNQFWLLYCSSLWNNFQIYYTCNIFFMLIGNINTRRVDYWIWILCFFEIWFLDLNVISRQKILLGEIHIIRFEIFFHYQCSSCF